MENSIILNDGSQEYVISCDAPVTSQTETRVEFQGGGYVDVSNGFKMVARGASISVNNTRVKVSNVRSGKGSVSKEVKTTMTRGEYLIYRIREIIRDLF